MTGQGGLTSNRHYDNFIASVPEPAQTDQPTDQPSYYSLDDTLGIELKFKH